MREGCIQVWGVCTEAGLTGVERERSAVHAAAASFCWEGRGHPPVPSRLPCAQRPAPRGSSDRLLSFIGSQGNLRGVRLLRRLPHVSLPFLPPPSRLSSVGGRLVQRICFVLGELCLSHISVIE
ncbi:hypothetical protein HJG60_009602 [Phyllostomus discolor]|uniref:Uncharacterized protein n=1 Tax=Phyllostomus discolor TaxID=89673 RepID=A0A833YGV1_9CHIR|nr:hypothetical protein HJG60_009602 [Phyllostomus discolor]